MDNTITQKLNTLRRVEDLAYQKLAELTAEDILSDNCAKSLNILERIHWFRMAMPAVAESSNPEPIPVKEAMPVATPEPEPTPVVEPKAEVIVTPETHGKTYKSSEVRAALAKARLNGLNVVELLKKFGADNFNSLSEDKYPAVMEEIGHAS